MLYCTLEAREVLSKSCKENGLEKTGSQEEKIKIKETLDIGNGGGFRQRMN